MWRCTLKCWKKHNLKGKKTAAAFALRGAHLPPPPRCQLIRAHAENYQALDLPG